VRINDNIGGTPVLIVHQPGSDTTTAFSARMNGKLLKFSAANSDATSSPNLETYSRWDPMAIAWRPETALIMGVKRYYRQLSGGGMSDLQLSGDLGFPDSSLNF
jgi:hypothetical protein